MRVCACVSVCANLREIALCRLVEVLWAQRLSKSRSSEECTGLSLHCLPKLNPKREECTGLWPHCLPCPVWTATIWFPLRSFASRSRSRASSSPTTTGKRKPYTLLHTHRNSSITRVNLMYHTPCSLNHGFVVFGSAGRISSRASERL